jgi:hypothetical protein
MGFHRGVQRGVHKGSGKAAKGAAGSSKKDSKDAKGKKASPLASLKKAIFGGSEKEKDKKGAAHAKKAEAPAPKKGAKVAAPAAPAPAPAQGKKAGKAPGSGKKGSGLPRTSIQSASFAASRHAASDADVCREVACEGLATTAGYCRLHYIKNWKKIKRKELILKEGKLNQYIEELVAKYPDKYIDAIRQDLAVEKEFAKVIYDLDLDEGVDEFTDDSGESPEAIIDNIKREFEDEGEGGF